MLTMHLFGRQRGSGETIWEITKNWLVLWNNHDYRVNCSVIDVIISPFLTAQCISKNAGRSSFKKAMEWLARLNLSALATSFRSLSWGQQRLLLITRAMVKHPPVLILTNRYKDWTDY